jgi:hypothetical protein
MVAGLLGALDILRVERDAGRQQSERDLEPPHGALHACVAKLDKVVDKCFTRSMAL